MASSKLILVEDLRSNGYLQKHYVGKFEYTFNFKLLRIPIYG